MTGRALCVVSLAGPLPPALSQHRAAGSSSQAKSYQCIRQFLQQQTLGNMGLDHPIIQAPQGISVGPVPWGETTAASGQRIWPLGFWLFPLRAGICLEVALLGLHPLTHPTPTSLAAVSPSWPQRPRFPWALSCLPSHLFSALTNALGFGCWPHTLQLLCLQPRAPDLFPECLVRRAPPPTAPSMPPKFLP